jgi:hypothetical protein
MSEAETRSLALPTGEDCSILFAVLVLLDLASRKTLVQDLQCRVAWVTPRSVRHARRRSPMMRPMEIRSAREEENDAKNEEHEQHHWEHPQKWPTVAIAPHVPRAVQVIPLGRRGARLLLRLLSDRLQRFEERDEDQDRKRSWPVHDGISCAANFFLFYHPPRGAALT